MPARENVGNWMNGIDPKKLLTRMKKNNANRYGTYLMKSALPMMSRPTELRTKPYALSPANCSLLGTIARRRDASQKKPKTRPAASTSWIIGFVTPKSPTLNAAGSSKLLGPGATKLSSARLTTIAAKLTCLPLLLFVLPPRQSVEPRNRHVDAEDRPEQDPDGDQKRGTQPSVGQPPEGAVNQHTRDDVAEGVPRIALR